jgi:hypothetical protein
MCHATALLLLTASIALPALAGVRSHSFQVGAVVVRSARVRVDSTRIRLLSAPAVAVSIDSAPPRLVRGGAALPDGTVRVTVHY